MKALSICVLVLGLVGGFAAAAGAAGPRAYLGLEGGAVALDDITFSGTTIEFDGGAAFGLVGGVDFSGPRLEAELVYRSNDVDRVVQLGLASPASGEVTTTSLMFNGYYDFVTLKPLTPYVGAGLGITNLDFDDVAAPGFFLTSGDDNDDSGFAFQLAAGVAWQAIDRLTIDLGYRYFVTEEIEFVDRLTGRIDEDRYVAHTFLLGVRAGF
jgi:opacity protein-like surface antigen